MILDVMILMTAKKSFVIMAKMDNLLREAMLSFPFFICLNRGLHLKNLLFEQICF